MSNSFKTELNDLINELDEENKSSERIKEWISNLGEDKLLDILKKINPYSIVGPDVDTTETVSFSYTNLRQDYIQKLCMTTMIAFLFRQMREYKLPDEIPAFDPDEYLADPSIIKPDSKITDARTIRLYEENEQAMQERVVINNFLKSMFEYDPDKHVTSSLKTNVADPERRLPKTRSAERALTYRNTVRATVAPEYEADVKDLSHNPSNQTEQDVFNNIPPVDTFSRMERYMENNYETLQQCTLDIYGAKPDMDLAIIVYDKHGSKEEAQKFKEDYMDQVIAPITNINRNRWVVLGPYRQNMERVDFYNRHTEILKLMLDKREEDSKIATDIMKKRVKAKKKKNVEEAGPDDPEFLKWVKQNKPEIAKMGAEHITDAKEEEKDDCPDDMVEINVFNVSDGGREMKVHKIYNKAEAPQVPTA